MANPWDALTPLLSNKMVVDMVTAVAMGLKLYCLYLFRKGKLPAEHFLHIVTAITATALGLHYYNSYGNEKNLFLVPLALMGYNYGTHQARNSVMWYIADGFTLGVLSGTLDVFK